MRDLRLALVQLESVVADRTWNLDRIGWYASQASAQNVDIICFPELSVTGYGRGSAMRGLAEPIPGPSTRALEAIARRARVTVVAGLLDAAGGIRVRNTQVVVSPDGLVGAYSKTHAPRTEWAAFDLGDSVRIFDHDKVRFGIQICYDSHFPELSSLMAGAGAELVLMPHASGGPESREDKVQRWMRFLPARAYDNAAFVAVCNASGTTAEGEPLPGIALALDPFGRCIAMTDSAAEQMLVVDCPAELLEAARDDPNGTFRDYRRPDLYGAAIPPDGADGAAGL